MGGFAAAVLFTAATATLPEIQRREVMELDTAG